MGQRAYVRGSNGKFAGSSSGGKVTYGKAGGFANASFRQRVLAGRGQKKQASNEGGQKVSKAAKVKSARDRVVGAKGSERRSLVKQAGRTAAVGALLSARGSRSRDPLERMALKGIGKAALVNSVLVAAASQAVKATPSKAAPKRVTGAKNKKTTPPRTTGRKVKR